MNELNLKNETRSMMKGTYDDHRLDKSNELNSRMSIKEQAPDEYEQKIKNLGGNE